MAGRNTATNCSISWLRDIPAESRATTVSATEVRCPLLEGRNEDDARSRLRSEGPVHGVSPCPGPSPPSSATMLEKRSPHHSSGPLAVRRAARRSALFCRPIRAWARRQGHRRLHRAGLRSPSSSPHHEILKRVAVFPTSPSCERAYSKSCSRLQHFRGRAWWRG
jgi:hypothetical protein